MITIQRNVVSGQSKGCWLAVQLGYTRVLLHDLWPRDRHQGAWVEVFVFAPAKYSEGYRRTHCGIHVRPFWRKSRVGLSVGAGAR